MNPMTDESPQPEAGFSEILFEPLQRKAETLFGAAFTPAGRARLLTAMRARQAQLRMDSFSDYAAHLRRESEEWGRLWPVALACEGAFFRPAAQFEVARDLLAEWSIMAQERSLRVLSLGCGSGFETCSLAMMLEEGGLRAKNWQVEIYGLDLNGEAIARAGAAVFAESDLEWLTAPQRRKWFSPRGGGWCFKSALAPPITLAVGNAYEPEGWPWGTETLFDLIFCRGLSLEAPPRAPRQLARVLRQALAPSGFIFTGPGEFLPDRSGDLHLEERGGVTYYRRGQHRFKANPPHLSKKQRAGRNPAPSPADAAPPPLDSRDQALMAEAARQLEAGRPEAARALLIEIMTGQMDQGRSQPEARALLAQTEDALGRPETAQATREAV